MSDILARYRAVDYALPKTYLSWDLFGAGLENLGRDGKPVELPLREPNPDEVLLRVDALGLCFSDSKLILAGAEHARIRGRDLKKDPTVAGHEAALTVVKAGSNWKNKFSTGQRFIIQADIFIKGEQKAFGYVQRGAMAQYTYVGPWVLDGDDGCYLLPIQDKTGYAEAALVEPWACVEAAYDIAPRLNALPGGKLLVVWCEALPADLDGLYPDQGPSLCACLGEAGCDLTPILGDSGLIARKTPDAAAIADLVREQTGDAGFDDILLIGAASGEVVAACDAALGKNGILAFIGASRQPATAFDIGRVHYHYTRHVGTPGMCAQAAYAANARRDLKPGGATWMIGAAGPMGQMHVQRALELEQPPAKLFASDLSAERLAYMEKRLAGLAKQRKIDLQLVNVGQVPDLNARLRSYAAAGFDDIYVHAPVAPLVEQAGPHLAVNSVLNVFAGVGLGTKASLSPEIFIDKHARLIGSSGSPMSAIKRVLEKMEGGRLATRMSLAALGGIEAVHAGIKGLKENRFPGKTVIFPQIKGLPLLAAEALGQESPAAAGKLENGSVWTNAAEQALLGERLKL